MDDPPEARSQLTLALILAAIAFGEGIDLALDRPASWWSFHVTYEVLLVVAAGAGATWLWRRWRQAVREGERLGRSLAARQAEADAWRASAEQALLGMGEAIDRQFRAWGFTPAEREVAFQLLRGISHKEIAFATQRSERTIRQHAAAAYAKAGLDGRAALAAYFLAAVRVPAI